MGFFRIHQSLAPCLKFHGEDLSLYKWTGEVSGSSCRYSFVAASDSKQVLNVFIIRTVTTWSWPECAGARDTMWASGQWRAWSCPPTSRDTAVFTDRGEILDQSVTFVKFLSKQIKWYTHFTTACLKYTRFSDWCIDLVVLVIVVWER